MNFPRVSFLPPIFSFFCPYIKTSERVLRIFYSLNLKKNGKHISKFFPRQNKFGKGKLKSRKEILGWEENNSLLIKCKGPVSPVMAGSPISP
jgi:hypothetical protein